MDVMEKLVELLAEYFNIGDSYAYNLTRVKSAFACGTVGLDDFEEFDDETVEDIASYIIDNGITVHEQKSPCSLCGYGGKHLDSPPCTQCPAHPKEQPNANQRNSNASNVQEWISVNDRLPEIPKGWAESPEPVLYMMKNTKTIYVGYYGEGGVWKDKYFRQYADSRNEVDADDVLCWMYQHDLPQPPKGE